MELMNARGHEVIGFARRHEQDLPSLYSEYFPRDLKTDSIGISLSALKTVKEIIYSSETRKKLKMLTEQTRPEIVHAHNIYGRLSTSVLDCLAEEGIPVVMTLHDYKLACPTYNFTYHHHICEDCRVHRYYRAVLKRCNKGSYAASAVYALESYYNWLFKKYENKVGIYIAPSRFLKSKLIDYGWPAQRFRYVPNFIDHTQYQPEYTPGEFFLYLGRLSEEKGIRILIEAFKRVEKPGIGLVVAGDGPLRATLEEISRSDSRIKFAGYLTGSALREITRRALAVVLPSVCYENAPLSILEAMAHGKPVIGAAVGGIPEMIDEGQNGFLFKPEDVRDLANKMEFLLNLPETSVVAMGKAAREKVKNDFNAESHYENIMGIYNALLRR
ncbi:MAG: glycosyltransferase family 4 protein [Deltaproteobacteria bacterium]|nr:glycosyltransferase family 4 protein [Deltaproteobacteria bacterium]